MLANVESLQGLQDVIYDQGRSTQLSLDSLGRALAAIQVILALWGYLVFLSAVLCGAAICLTCSKLRQG